MDLLQTMNDYRREASWAIWGVDEFGKLTGDESFRLVQAAGTIHGRVMFVSLNPGSDRANETELSTPDWANFHSTDPVHNDMFLAEATFGTPLWGAYMTDLHPHIPESDSRLISSTAAEIELSVRSLIEQAKLLGTVETIICVGGKSYDSVNKHAALIERELAIDRAHVVKIPHYSNAAAGVHGRKADRYRALVLEAVGLPDEG